MTFITGVSICAGLYAVAFTLNKLGLRIGPIYKGPEGGLNAAVANLMNTTVFQEFVMSMDTRQEFGIPAVDMRAKSEEHWEAVQVGYTLYWLRIALALLIVHERKGKILTQAELSDMLPRVLEKAKQVHTAALKERGHWTTHPEILTAIVEELSDMY